MNKYHKGWNDIPERKFEKTSDVFITERGFIWKERVRKFRRNFLWIAFGVAVGGVLYLILRLIYESKNY